MRTVREVRTEPVARDGGGFEERTANSTYRGGGGPEAGELTSEGEGWEVPLMWEAFPSGNVRPSPPHLPGLPTLPVPRSSLGYRRWLLNYASSSFRPSQSAVQCGLAAASVCVLQAPDAS